jgi:hypothetical protein
MQNILRLINTNVRFQACNLLDYQSRPVQALDCLLLTAKGVQTYMKFKHELHALN